MDISELINDVEASYYQRPNPAVAEAMGLPLTAENEMLATLPPKPIDFYENKYAEQLAATGLSLEEKQGGAEGEVHITLSDPDQFVSYLHALASGAITATQVNALQKLTDAFSAELSQGEWKLRPQSTELLISLMSARDAISKAYATLDPQDIHGLSARFDRIDGLLKAAQQGYANEYLLANECLDTKGFGPMTWHTDADEAQYNARWQEALKIVARIGENGKASALQQELIRTLLESIDYAQRDIPQRYPQDDRKQLNASFLDTLRQAREVLSKLKK